MPRPEFIAAVRLLWRRTHPPAGGGGDPPAGGDYPGDHPAAGGKDCGGRHTVTIDLNDLRAGGFGSIVQAKTHTHMHTHARTISMYARTITHTR